MLSTIISITESITAVLFPLGVLAFVFYEVYGYKRKYIMQSYAWYKSTHANSVQGNEVSCFCSPLANPYQSKVEFIPRKEALHEEIEIY